MLGRELERFDGAISARDLERAWSLAREISDLPLDRALALIILAGEEGDTRYEPATRRFMVRVLEEIEPPNLQTKRLADCVTCVDDPECGWEAREGLARVVGQLRRRARRISLEFEGPP